MTREEFKEARKYLCLSQADLAKIWDCDIKTIGRWERGERPVNKIAAYCLRMMVEGAKE